MDLTVVTGWSPEGYELYGRNFMDGFERFWPKDVRLLAYVEETRGLARAEEIVIHDVPGVASFLARHEGNLETRGRRPNERWSEKNRARGYDYRFDAYKFGRVPIYLRHAAGLLGKGPMIWLDGDVMTFALVTTELIGRVLPESADVAYLGRVGKHSEIGYQGYRLPAAHPFICEFANLYLTDGFLQLPEWHSAYCFDHTVRHFEGAPLRTLNLTPEGSRHVWFQSPLGQAMDHLKGDRRKQRGRSAERAA